MKTLLSSYIVLVLSIVGCDISQRTPPVDVAPVSDIDPIASRIGQAHGKSLLDEYGYVRFDIEKSFGGSAPTTATITASTDGGRIRLDTKSGRTIVWDRGELRSTSDDDGRQGDRFEIFTWQYFFMLPYKLADPGVNLLAQPQVDMDGQAYETVWLAFDNGTGDASDDWYRLHIDQASGRIEHAGYIVTAGGKTPEEAAANAHSITYDDYTPTAGIPISRSWTFSNYDADTQQVRDSIGYARISNISFPEGEELSWDL
jgi:hypothetical protein